MGERVFSVTVQQIIEVKLDADKFDEAFMGEFRQSFFHFDTIEQHAEHIAQMQARGVIDVSWNSGDFIEGYGPASDMGIKARAVDTDYWLIKTPEHGWLEPRARRPLPEPPEPGQ